MLAVKRKEAASLAAGAGRNRYGNVRVSVTGAKFEPL